MVQYLQVLDHVGFLFRLWSLRVLPPFFMVGVCNNGEKDGES